MRAEVTLKACAGGRGRRVGPALVAAALAGWAFVAPAAEAAATAPAPTTTSQRLQQRFIATAQGWRKAVLKLPGAKPHEAELVRDLRIVVAPTPLPLLRVHTRLEGHMIIVSAGWLALLDDLLRAEALSEVAADGKACLAAYEEMVKTVLEEERKAAAGPTRGWPRPASLLEADRAPTGCAKLRLVDLRSPAVQARVEDLADTAVLWLLTLQAARLVALAVPTPAPAPAAPAPAPAEVPAAAPSGEKPAQTECKLPKATSTESSAETGGAGRAVPAAAASTAAFANERAQLALDCYGRKLPKALCWLRANSVALFDKETVKLLSN